MTKPALSVIMPAYLEAKNIRVAVASTTRALKKSEVADYEIIIMTGNRPDGTNDGTPEIAAGLAQSLPKVRTIHDPNFSQMGAKYWRGVQAAKFDYITLVPSDNETEEETVSQIAGRTGEADMVTSYTANTAVRAVKRRIVSRGFVWLCNLLFGLNFRYYNGMCIQRRDQLLAIPFRSDNFAYMAAIIIYLAKSGVSYIQAPMVIKPTTATTSFKFKSVIECLGTLAQLFWRIHFKRERVLLSAARSAARIG